MDHVNNAVYADWLDEAVIAAGGEPRSARSRAWSGSSTPARPNPARASSPTPGPTTMGGRAGSWTRTERTCFGRDSSLGRRDAAPRG